MPNYSPFPSYDPYRTNRSLRRGFMNDLQVTDPSTWSYTRGRFVAFGAAAEQRPEAGDMIYLFQNSMDPSEESFRLRPNGRIYYRFRCTPLVCGNMSCQGQTRVMTSFAPPGWDSSHGYHYGNPFNPQHQTRYSGQVFCYHQGGQMHWNEAVWGSGPPAGWGH